MKKRVFVVLLALLVVGGIAFAATAAPDPKYGGRITFTGWAYTAEPDSPDIADGLYSHTYWLSAIQETPVVGDIEKYGPRGNGEYAFQSRGYIPWKYLKGHLIEKWEVTTQKLTWHVRPGIFWAGRDVMKSRELVAEDVRADLQYFWDSSSSSRWKDYISKIYTTDKYTVVMDFKSFSPFVMYYIGYEDRALTSPPETQGLKSYEKMVGTGPWMFKEYSPGSYMAYAKNPNYWKSTTVNGKSYKLPFADEMRSMIIPDVTTAVAALRTGKIDFMHITPYTQWKSLAETAPALKRTQYTFGGGVINLKSNEPPFDNIDVRRAMFIGTDLQAFHDLGGLPKDFPLHWYPYFIGNPETYLPLAKLPAKDQALFKYDPALARKMLADAGYPNGFKTTFTGIPGYQNIADLLKSQWAKIGVDLEITVLDNTAFTAALRAKTYKGTTYSGLDVVSPANTVIDYGMKDKLNNYSVWSDPKYENIANQVATVVDEAKRTELMKQALLMLFESVSTIPVDPQILGHWYWPWLGNYFGELTMTDGAIDPVLAYAWVDQDMKKKMGYEAASSRRGTGDARTKGSGE